MAMERDDKQLIRDYLAGDEESFEQLLDKYLKSVYNFIYKICRNTEDTDDIVQDSFFKAWKSLKRYREDESFKTWLFTIARNTAIDHLRKKKNFVFSDFDNIERGNIVADTLSDGNPLQDEIFSNMEDKKTLEDTLDKLSPINRQVLILKYENDFTFDEIGKILGKPLNTVKSQYRRALESLHQNIDLKRINKHDR